jgi:hypothetical protein
MITLSFVDTCGFNDTRKETSFIVLTMTINIIYICCIRWRYITGKNHDKML